jgi:predicted permease
VRRRQGISCPVGSGLWCESFDFWITRSDRPSSKDIVANLCLWTMKHGLGPSYKGRRTTLKIGGRTSPCENGCAFARRGIDDQIVTRLEDEEGLSLMQDLLLDVRFALRGFRRNPAFALVAVLSLALAIGANGFVFAVLNTVVLRPFEVSDPQSLYQIRYGPRMSGSNLTTSYPAFQDLRRRNTSFSDMIGIYAYSEASLSGRDAGPRFKGVAVSGNYFDMLGVQPQIGRLFNAADERGLNSAPYVVLSDALWRRVFGGEASVVGTTVRLNEQPFTVIGVAAASFHGAERFSWPDYWIPIINNLGGAKHLLSREGRAVLVIGRLKPGVTPQQATADLNAITALLAKEYPKTDKSVAVRLIRSGLMGDDGEGIRRFLYSVNVLALLLLAAVCVNLASAFAARAADRSRELAVRVALGSSRSRLVRQLLTEALVITVVGGAAGLTSARGLLAVLNRWPASLGAGYQRLDLDLDPRVYLAGLALTVASALLIGMIPARRAWAGSPMQVIKNGLAAPTRRRLSLGDVLLVAQISICALLVTASFVAVRGMRRALHGSSAGIRPQGVMLASIDLGGLEGDPALEKQREMIEAVRSIPGVTAVGAVRETPMSWPRRVIPVYRPGTTALTPENQALAAHVYPMSPEYLKAAGTRLLEGRDVSWQDGEATPPVAIVNGTFARKMWGDAEAIGQRFLLWERSTEVVGVVEDGKYYNLMESPAAAAFVPLAQHTGGAVLVVRSSLPATETASALLHTLGRVQPNVPVTLRTWPKALERVLYPARAAAFALGVMGLFAVMLAVTGIFGTAAHSVSRRVRELGTRMALGASEAQVVLAAVGRPTVLLGVGSALGLLTGVFASRLLGRIVYQADPSDPAVLVGAVLTMALIGISGFAVPALRALAVDPSRLMREE